MDITGEHRLPAAPDTVWAGLNDPEVLGACIPGCESIEKESDLAFTAQVRAAIGPVKARFDTRMELSDLDPPNRYTLSGGGQGGAAGFSRGSVDVELEADGDGTVLRYSARFQVGGRLAQIGSRLVAGATRKVAAQFFDRFEAHITGAGEGASATVG